MNACIDLGELENVKKMLAEWAKELPECYTPKKKCNNVSFTEKEFYAIAKCVANLERKNRENAKCKLSDFRIEDILQYLAENKEAKAVLYVDKSHEYDVKSNVCEIHGFGEDRIIIIH